MLLVLIVKHIRRSFSFKRKLNDDEVDKSECQSALQKIDKYFSDDITVLHLAMNNGLIVPPLSIEIVPIFRYIHLQEIPFSFFA
jgi:hypothetical protein